MTSTLVEGIDQKKDKIQLPVVSWNTPHGQRYPQTKNQKMEVNLSSRNKTYRIYKTHVDWKVSYCKMSGSLNKSRRISLIPRIKWNENNSPKPMAYNESHSKSHMCVCIIVYYTLHIIF